MLGQRTAFLHKVACGIVSFTWRAAVFAAFWALPLTASAQDALRYSLAGEQAAQARNQLLEGGSYNLRLGDARFLADASLTVEANDNVTISDSGAQGDVILRPQVHTAVFWPVTDKNALNFSIGLGYVKYLSLSQYDYLLVAPGSELSFDLFVGDFRFKFFDRFSYTQDPLQNGALSGVGNYGGLDNSAGLNGLWDLDKVILTAGYAHQIFIPDQQVFQYLNRSSELFLARAAFLLSSAITVGPEATSSLTTYDHAVLANADSYSGGAFAQAKVTPHIALNAHAGYVTYDFQNQGSGGTASGKPAPYYVSVGVDHTLNQFITQSLTGGHEVQLGVFSDFQELSYARYTINWNMIRNVGLGTQFFYEHGTYPATLAQFTGLPQISGSGETYDRVGAAINLSYHLMQKLTSTLGYRLTFKDSNMPGLGYTQNAVTLGLTYQF